MTNSVPVPFYYETIRALPVSSVYRWFPARLISKSLDLFAKKG